MERKIWSLENLGARVPEKRCKMYPSVEAGELSWCGAAGAQPGGYLQVGEGTSPGELGEREGSRLQKGRRQFKSRPKFQSSVPPSVWECNSQLCLYPSKYKGTGPHTQVPPWLRAI